MGKIIVIRELRGGEGGRKLGEAKTERERGRKREVISKRKVREVYRGSRELKWRKKSQL